MIIISIVNRKGGTGKTTTAINLAGALSVRNYSVLLIDCDSQANATMGVGITPISTNQIFENILSTKFSNLAIMPSCRDFIQYEELAVREGYSLQALQKKLLQVKYSFKIIDCPPNLSWLTINALIASDLVIVPMQAEFFSLTGLNEVVNVINTLNAKNVAKCKLHGILITMYNMRAVSMQNICSYVKDNFYLYDTKIPRNIRLSEATSYGIPCVLWETRCSGSVAYQEFTSELLDMLR